MSMDYIRDAYGVPAKLGGRVIYEGAGPHQCGTITGTRNAHLLIRLDGESQARPYHPTWKLQYLSAPVPPSGGAGR